MWGTFPLTATDTLIPEVGLLAPRCQSHLKKLPSPLALGSEGTSKADPKTRDRGRPARLPGLWLAGFLGSRKSPFACCFLEKTPGHSDVLCLALWLWLGS